MRFVMTLLRLLLLSPGRRPVAIGPAVMPADARFGQEIAKGARGGGNDGGLRHGFVGVVVMVVVDAVGVGMRDVVFVSGFGGEGC
ncbi:hypothetical protein BDR22DRAFT_844608 [Usnea florida]